MRWSLKRRPRREVFLVVDDQRAQAETNFGSFKDALAFLTSQPTDETRGDKGDDR